MNNDFLFTTQEQNEISISFFGNSKKLPVVLFVHGFKGFKDWGFGPEIGKFFCNKGFNCITFNFSHNGVGLHTSELNEPEKFEKNSYSLEISELKELIHFVENSTTVPCNGEIFLAGHSRGGAVSMLAGLNNPLIRGVSVWGSIASINRFTKRQIELWKQQGYLNLFRSENHMQFRAGTALLEDILERTTGELNILETVRTSTTPLQIIHGKADLTVRVQEAEKLFSARGGKNTELRIVTGAGHTFGVVHPFQGNTAQFLEVLELTSGFFRNINSFNT